MALPKTRHPLGLNIYYLGYHVKKKLSSTEKIHDHGQRAYIFQEQTLQDIDACYAKGICYSCGLGLAYADDCDDAETRR